jgi:aminoglycoside phosphotransferase (APT) family kinase protein
MPVHLLLLSKKKFEQVIHRIDPHSRLLRVWVLEGGVSARVTALEIEQPGGQTQKMIVRQYGDADLRRNPRVAAAEFKLLQFLQAAGVAAPAPYYLDQSGEIFSTPYVVIEYVEGKTEFAPVHLDDFIFQLATYLSGLHRIDCSKLDMSLLPEQEKKYTELLGSRPEKVDESLDEGHIRDVLEGAWPLPRRNIPVLLHGDFWPGNVLWKEGRLVAVIDWEDAALGDPLADVANTRLEMLWALGIEAMHRFTQQYQSMTTIDFTDLPFWDLCAALRPIGKMAGWSLDEATERAMRERHRWFVARAFEQLSL